MRGREWDDLLPLGSGQAIYRVIVWHAPGRGWICFWPERGAGTFLGMQVSTNYGIRIFDKNQLGWCTRLVIGSGEYRRVSVRYMDGSTDMIQDGEITYRPAPPF